MRRITAFIMVAAFFLALVNTSSGSSRDLSALFPIKQQGKWGFTDPDGKMVISPKFYRALGFFEGLAAVTVKKGGKWGFINKTGKMVIPPQFEAVHWFSERLCAVRQDKKWGFIDPTGKLVIQAQYEQVGSFSEGLAPVKSDAEQKWGFVDRTGKLAIPYAFTYAGDFAEERAWVELNGKAGIIDPTGKVAFAGSKPPDGDWSKFTGGLARAYSQGKWGYVDKAGQFTIEPRFDYAWDFSGPTAVVQLGEGSGVIDRTGKLVVQMQLPARLGETFDGLTSFTRDGEYWGFVDASGKTVIPPAFFPPRHGRAPLRTPLRSRLPS